MINGTYNEHTFPCFLDHWVSLRQGSSNCQSTNQRTLAMGQVAADTCLYKFSESPFCKQIFTGMQHYCLGQQSNYKARADL